DFALEDCGRPRHRPRRALQRRLPLPARRVPVAQAVPDRCRGPGRLEYLDHAQSACGLRKRAVSTPPSGVPPRFPLKLSRATRWAMGVAVAVIAAIAIVLLFL